MERTAREQQSLWSDTWQKKAFYWLAFKGMKLVHHRPCWFILEQSCSCGWEACFGMDPKLSSQARWVLYSCAFSAMFPQYVVVVLGVSALKSHEMWHPWSGTFWQERLEVFSQSFSFSCEWLCSLRKWIAVFSLFGWSSHKRVTRDTHPPVLRERKRERERKIL